MSKEGRMNSTLDIINSARTEFIEKNYLPPENIYVSHAVLERLIQNEVDNNSCGCFFFYDSIYGMKTQTERPEWLHKKNDIALYTNEKRMTYIEDGKVNISEVVAFIVCPESEVKYAE